MMPFMSNDEFKREQAIARIKCEQELVRLDTELVRFDRANEVRLDSLDESFDISFDTCEILAPLRFLFENRIMNTDALIDAVKKGQTSVVKMLLAHVNPSAGNNYVIRIASENGHTEVVKVLLADPPRRHATISQFAWQVLTVVWT